MGWYCTGCGSEYAEYVNGCPRCWDAVLSIELNHIVYPIRKVVRYGSTPGQIGNMKDKR